MIRRPAFILIFLLAGFISVAQQSDLVRVYLKDACDELNVPDALVTLESYKKKPIIAKYNKKKQYYYFKEVPEDYNTIFASHKNFEIEGFKRIDSFPQRINLMLNCKGNIRLQTERQQKSWVNDGPYSKEIVKTDTIFSGIVVVHDNYKVKISVKNSYDLSFNEVKKKIDSLVAPYGLEYIDDLFPNLFYTHFPSMGNKYPERSYLIDDLDRNRPLSDLLMTENSIYWNISRSAYLQKGDPFSFWESYYYEILYRKKDKTPFDGDCDLLLNEISEHNTNLDLQLVTHYKFRIEENYPLKINCKNLAKYDKQLMNYQFLDKFGNDPTRLMFMDRYFDFEDTFLGKYELDMIIDGEVQYTPPPSETKSNFRYKLELAKPSKI
ncbi:hypothetical protein ACFFLS_21735 [Flavobacterium procerum]|uniref:YARHG domain-containing protein n=1 Tax=Flavobacterium procerum TaxID=1455569 RepID=A0ABV6BW63_9FLAO